MKNKILIGHLLSLVVIVMYSFNANIMKLLMPEHIGAYGLSLLRNGSAFICFFVLSLFLKKEKRRISPSDIWTLSCLGAMCVGIPILLYAKGLEQTGPINTVIIRTLVPIIVISIGAMFYHKGISRNQIYGTLLGLAGVVYVSVTPHNHTGVQDSIVGDSIVFLSSILSAFYFILVKPFTSSIAPITMMKWIMLAATVVCIPFGYNELINAPMFHTSTSLVLWCELLFSALVVGVLTNILTIIALRYISPTTNSAYYYTLPLFATVIAVAFKLQTPSWHEPIAFVLILTGFILVNKKKVTMS